MIAMGFGFPNVFLNFFKYSFEFRGILIVCNVSSLFIDSDTVNNCNW